MTNPGSFTRFLKRFLMAVFCLSLISCGQTITEEQLLQNAKSYLDKKELKAASIELRNILQKNRENAEARYLLGNINFEIGDLSAAEKEFRRAAAAGWDQQQTQVNIARILLARNEHQELLDKITIVDTWNPETRANIYALRALAYAGLGQLLKAQAELEKGKEYNTDALYVLKATAMFQFYGLQAGDITATLDKALNKYPDNPEILLFKASNQIQNDQLKQAADTFSKVVDLDPPKIITTNGRIALIGLTRLKIIDKDIKGANEILAGLLKRNDKDPAANYLAGLLALNQGNYTTAEEYIRKLQTVAPDYTQAQQVMGKIKYALKDYDQASQYLSTYLNSNPDDLAVRKLLTNTYIILNQPDMAKATLQDATAVDPDDPGVLTLLSQIEFNKGDLNAGILSLSKAIKSSPESAELHKQLAKAYITAGDLDNALGEIKIFHNMSNDIDETQKLGIAAYLKMGEVDKAIGLASKMLARKPKDPDIIALNGSLYAANNDNKQARSFFNQALELKIKLPSATIGLARLETKEGHYDKAANLYNGLVDSNIGGTVPILALSELAAQQDNVNEMLSWLEKARIAAPTEIKPRVILANYYLGANQPDKAAVYIQEALKLSPEHNELLTLQSKVLIAQKRYEAAVPLLKKLVDTSPDAINVRVLLSEAYLRQGLIKDARVHLQKILDKEGNNALALTLLSEAEYKDGHYNKSLEYAKRLQNIQPELSLGYLLEGNVWLSKKDYKKSYSAYQAAWQKQQSADLAMKLFATANNNQEFDNAIKPLLTWMNKNPDDQTTRFYLATTYQNANRYEHAITEYEYILKGAPDSVAVLNNLAWLYSLNNDPKALDYAEKAYRLTQSEPGILDTYGWILVKQGKTDKGLRLLEQAMEQIPDNLEVRYHYAAALIQSNNKNEGQKILESLINLNKPFTGRNEAQQLLAKQFTTEQ